MMYYRCIFFKQKTAYEVRISDWSSDVCASDLNEQLQIVGRYLGAASSDVIGILSAIGRDTAGALSIGRAGTASPAGWRVVEREDDLERIINELPSKPFLIGQNGVSMSLAGVQSKPGVAVDHEGRTIGRASCRERVCQYGYISVLGVS